jgi:alanine transaminase
MASRAFVGSPMRTGRFSPGRSLRRCSALQLRHASGKLSVASLNQSVVKAEYAVRGEIVLRAAQLRAQLAEQPGSLPFDKLVECNIGNPQALKQQPISFNRQVLSLLANPAMLDWPELVGRLPPDVLARTKEYLTAIPQGIGAYSESQGFGIVRQQVADFISARDGVPADAKNIFLTVRSPSPAASPFACGAPPASLSSRALLTPATATLQDGASKGVQTLLKAVLKSADDGVLVPIPQYPLYSASLVLDGAQMIGYYLSEANGWEMPIEVRQAGGSQAARCLPSPPYPTPGASLPRRCSGGMAKR